MVSVTKRANVYCRKAGEAVEVQLKFAQLFRPVDTSKGPSKELVLERPLSRGSTCSRAHGCAEEDVDCVLVREDGKDYLDFDKVTLVHSARPENPESDAT